MDSKTRLGRNPFEKRVIRVANKRDPLVPQVLFHYGFEVPARGAFLAYKAYLLTSAFARELNPKRLLSA